MEPLTQNWWQYGALGAIAGLFLVSFLWAFKVLFSRVLLHFDELKKFFEVTTETMKAITKSQESIEDQHAGIVERIRELTDEMRTTKRPYQRAGTKHD